jgi:hypothetical protein
MLIISVVDSLLIHFRQNVCLFGADLKRTKTDGTKCHAKTMMSIKADKDYPKTIKQNPRKRHSGRTRRDKD